MTNLVHFSAPVANIGQVSIQEIFPKPRGRKGQTCVTLLVTLQRQNPFRAGILSREIEYLSNVTRSSKLEHPPWPKRGSQYIMVAWVEDEPIRDTGKFIKRKVAQQLADLLPEVRRIEREFSRSDPAVL